MAEIEHFYDPLENTFENYDVEMAEFVIPIWTEKAQLSGNTMSAVPLSNLDIENNINGQSGFNFVCVYYAPVLLRS